VFPQDENPVPVQEIVELFICILLHLIRKQSMAPSYLPYLMGNIKIPTLKQVNVIAIIIRSILEKFNK
jgi:hypothetical protein